MFLGDAMEPGTAIFLSSALIALVLLYGFTKDRWRWRRVIGRTLVAMLALVLVGSAALALLLYWDDIVPTKLSNRQIEFAGLKLGMKADEVMYIKGYPPVILGDENSDPTMKGFFAVI